MRKYTVGIVGFYANGQSKAGGQEAKTWSITEALWEEYGKEEIATVDTLHWKKNPFSLFWKLFRLHRQSENIVMLPAQNSVRVFIPVFSFFNLFSRRRLHYAVVGGWLPELLKKHKRLAKKAKKLYGIYVETSSLKTELEKQGFTNVKLLPNFKKLQIQKEEELSQKQQTPLRLCTFSRVMPEKGIADVVESVRAVNEKHGEVALELDVYGKIDPNYIEWFEEFQKTFPPYIRYCGMVEPHESVATLKEYFALVFPTRYKTEGIPGTIIDAYAAGLPVITALWNNCVDVFEEGVTGFGFALGNTVALTSALERALDEKEALSSMRFACLKKAREFSPEKAISVLIENILVKK